MLSESVRVAGSRPSRQAANPLSASETLSALTSSLSLLPPTPFRTLRPLVLAVSGGPDSLGLMVAVAANRARLGEAGHAFHVVTVDHGLRPQSAVEAQQVATQAARLDLSHETLVWANPAPGGNLPAAARAARYALLQTAARRIGAAAIMTAHHQDDQIETHCLAAARRAGDRGLAGMQACRQIARDLFLLRPFLDATGERLKATALASGLAAVADPSNDDERYDRVRLRKSLLAGRIDRQACLDAIAAAGARRDRIDDGLDGALAAWTNEDRFRVSPEATLHVDAESFRGMDQPLAAAFLARVLPAVAGADYAPGQPARDRLAERLRQGTPCRVTLGGTVIEAGHDIVFSREFGRSGPAAVDLAAAGEMHTLFDRRFAFALPQGLADRTGARLVAAGRLPIGNPIERTLPVLVGSGDHILAVPDILAKKFPRRLACLELCEDISWRLIAGFRRGSADSPTMGFSC